LACHARALAIAAQERAKRYEWRVGETTDDTEQTLAVADTLITEGGLSHSSVGQRLMNCRKSNHPDVSLGRFQQSHNVTVSGDTRG